MFEVSQNQDGPWSSDLDCRQSYEARLLLSKVTLAPLASMREVPVSAMCYIDPEPIISAVEPKDLANGRAVMIGKSQKWKLKVTFEPLQQNPGPLKPMDLAEKEDIDATAVSVKAFPEDAKKVVKNIKKQKITPENISRTSRTSKEMFC